MTTDPDLNARLAALEGRRSASAQPGHRPVPSTGPRRRHVASDARRVAAGLAATAVLGLVAVMGLGRVATAGGPTPAPATGSPAPASGGLGGSVTPDGSSAAGSTQLVPRGDRQPSATLTVPDTASDGSTHGSR